MSHPLKYHPVNTSFAVSSASPVSGAVCPRAAAALLPPINSPVLGPSCALQPPPQLALSCTAQLSFSCARSSRVLICTLLNRLLIVTHWHRQPSARGAFGASCPTTKGSSFCKDDHSLFRGALWVYTTNNYSDTVTLKRNP